MTDILDQQSIAQWCQDYVAGLLDVPADSIALDATFDRLGIDSAHAVALLIEIESRYGIDLPPEALFENPTLGAVAQYLYEQSS
ncbi:MAG: acyl carrier protein [Rhodococcus sp. (in: high G+C Gram-positive bacteria)]|jgi:acyl carrier protein|uniref:acyl carrier protein n=1 Tax=Rhodococcus sp. EPR-157 TaxID=1813677 RepID=UPI0007BC48C6|nr:acyl carrier protein [Rhodococcus sp. EPR-157]KZF01656.1 phosphopantetheine-binding protein [Rhodococcus sp. EPR-157]